MSRERETDCQNSRAASPSPADSSRLNCSSVSAAPGRSSVCDAANRSAVSSGRVGISRANRLRSEEHTSELQSLMRNSYAVFCLKKKKNKKKATHKQTNIL